jgi:predicted CXXCH cytochrome family protein
MPFARGQCQSCHLSRGGASLAVKGPALCLKCHETFKPVLDRKLVHAPIQGERGCVACHNPHAGQEAELLPTQQDELCWRCHDRSLAKGKVAHAALEQGCNSCHDPHAADHKKLLSEDVDGLCRNCHADLSKHFHPTGNGKAADPRTGQALDCVSCHRPHGSELEALLTHDPKRDLCVQCHDPNMMPARR